MMWTQDVNLLLSRSNLTRIVLRQARYHLPYGLTSSSSLSTNQVPFSLHRLMTQDAAGCFPHHSSSQVLLLSTLALPVG